MFGASKRISRKAGRPPSPVMTHRDDRGFVKGEVVSIQGRKSSHNECLIVDKIMLIVLSRRVIRASLFNFSEFLGGFLWILEAY